MSRMNSLFSTVIDPEEVLPEFIQWYHDNGNFVGGYSIDDMPQNILEMAQALEKVGYVELWTKDRYCIKDEYRSKLLISYHWTKLTDKYIKEGKAVGARYNQLIRNMWFYLSYYSPKDDKDKENKNKAINKAKEKLFEMASIEELEEFCFDGGCQIEFKDEKIINKLSNAQTVEDVDKILQQPFERVYTYRYPKEHDEPEWFRFIYGKEYLVVLANLKDKKKIKELLSNNMPGVERVRL